MLITVDDVRGSFRVENTVPDALIQRALEWVDDVFSDNFGSLYTNVVAQPTDYPTESHAFKTAHLYLTMVRLMSERYVLTGFGVVRKKDEYSDEVTQDTLEKICAMYVKDASIALNRLFYDKTIIARVISQAQGVYESFFTKSNDCVLHVYNPYLRFWF